MSETRAQFSRTGRSAESAPQTLKEKLTLARRAVSKKSGIYVRHNYGSSDRSLSGPAVNLEGNVLTIGNGDTYSVFVSYYPHDSHAMTNASHYASSVSIDLKDATEVS